MNPLAGWANFYTIVGSSAGALIGLQFVAMSLLSELPAREGTEEAGNAFATPTIVHFSAVLCLGGLMSAPWPVLWPVIVQWGLLGGAGLAYTGIVASRMRRQRAYRPEFEDWLFHAFLPASAYGAIALAALTANRLAAVSLFGVAGAAMLILFVGIHNTWDAVTYHIFVLRRKLQQKKNSPSPE